MALVSEPVAQGDCGRPGNPSLATDGDASARLDAAAELTQVLLQRLQTSLIECQAMVDYSRAQVIASRALVGSRSTD